MAYTTILYTSSMPSLVHRALHSKLEIICDLLNEGFLVYSIGNCLWDFFHRLFGLITHLKVFKKKIAEDSLWEARTSQGLRKHETTVYHKIQTGASLSTSRFCLFHTFERIIQRSTGCPQSWTQQLTSNKTCSSENFSFSKLFCQAVKNSSRQ